MPQGAQGALRASRVQWALRALKWAARIQGALKLQWAKGSSGIECSRLNGLGVQGAERALKAQWPQGAQEALKVLRVQ